jgi:hypothetical protein
VVDTGPVVTPTRTATLARPLAPGDYRWRVKVTDGDRLVAPDGRPGLASAYGHFRVAP